MGLLRIYFLIIDTFNKFKFQNLNYNKKIRRCSRRGLNSRPSDYETNALPTAPREHLVNLNNLYYI